MLKLNDVLLKILTCLFLLGAIAVLFVPSIIVMMVMVFKKSQRTYYLKYSDLNNYFPSIYAAIPALLCYVPEDGSFAHKDDRFEITCDSLPEKFLNAIDWHVAERIRVKGEIMKG